MTGSGFVIVGAGLAGAKAAEALREQGYDGQLTLIGNENHRPYERPPLSKGYLTGKEGLDKVFVHPEGWYADHDVDLCTGATAVAIDRVDHTVRHDDGTRTPYTKLLIATGSRPRQLTIPGADAEGVLSLRTIDDSDAIKATLGEATRMVIIGAGWIGLEVAAAARDAGLEVTIVEIAELPLLRVLGHEIAQVFADLHREHGVELHFGAKLSRITTADGRATGAQLEDGTALEADAVLVGVGAAPNVALAEDAGLEVEDGILTDAGLRTSDPDIYAAGDVAAAMHPVLGKRIRVEHWANALHQPAVAAAAMRGESVEYTRLPYFYTDQYDLGMEYVGHAEPGSYDAVRVRGDLAKREFIAFWTRQDRVLAAMNVNIWDVVDDLRTVILSGDQIPPDRLSDASIPLQALTP